MRKTLLGVASSVALGATLLGPAPAQANPALIAIPWLIVAGAGGLAVGAVAVSQSPRALAVANGASGPAPSGYGAAYGPDAAPIGAPTAAGVCHIAHAQTPNGGWRSVEVCD
jgi:hypothetical protein